MGFWVYILRCADNSYYRGHTDDLEKRLAEHYDGECGGYTSTRLPVKLVYSEEFTTREEALACEQQIKGWRRKKKEALIRGDWKEVSRLGRKYHTSTLRLNSGLSVNGISSHRSIGSPRVDVRSGNGVYIHLFWDSPLS